MPSSTSNSNARLPADRWGLRWGIALVLAALLLGGYEWYLRSAGVRPSAPRVETWVVSRGRLDDTSAVAVGSSRMLALVDPEVWAEEYGGATFIQLATLGGSTIVALEHLAETTSFRGLVLADVVPFWGFTNRWLPTALADELGAYRATETSPARWSEAHLRVYLASVLALRRPEAKPRRLFRAILQGTPIAAAPSGLLRNGYGPLRFRAVGATPNPARIMSPASFANRRAVVPNDAELETMFARLFRAIDRIESRGGRVVLIYLPACGGVRDMEERLFPKSRFWTPIVERARTAIDFDAYPDRASIPCYDGSHLDIEDAARVTRWLVSQLRHDDG